MMRKNSLAFVLPTLSLAALAACSEPAGEPAAIQSRVTLQSFPSCDALEGYIEDTAVRDMNLQLDQILEGGGPVFDRSAESPQASGGAAGPSAYTTTNTQVAGVDEADFVKNDGTRIFTLSGQTLFAARSWPAADLAVVGKLTIEGYPTQMFLRDNQVVVFSSIYTSTGGGGGGVADAACAPGLRCGGGGATTTKITVVDVSDLARPRVKREFFLPGSYSNSRRIGGSVRLVLSDGFRFPSGVRFWPESADGGLWNDKVRLRGVLAQLKVENERVIRGQKLSDWLSTQSYREDGGPLTQTPYSCSDFYQSNTAVRLGILTVATLNLDDPRKAPTRTSIIGEPGEVYASQKALYVASQHWWWWSAPGQMDYTYLHKFDLSDPSRARYVASGGVEGHIVDQFSLDEHNDFLRVATTINTRVPDLQNPQNTWGQIQSTNRITVLGENRGALVAVGRTPELAKGERIYSARFLGDRGFVVTFRNIDPLFSFDLSNPQAPRQVGELKVPGFSSYIHPLDKGHLLTIGTFLPETGETWTGRRIQLSIFDVTDLKNPKQSHVTTLGDSNSYSEAQWEHKAFNYFPAKKLLAVPFSDWNWNGSGDYWSYFTSDLRVFGIDTATGFTVKGKVSMSDLYRVANYWGWSYYWQPAVRRSVMADDFVYAISDAGIRVAHISALSSPLATVQFDRYTDYY